MENVGLPLSRATLANWIIRSAEDWLMPFVERLKALLLEHPVIHADETPVQVIKETKKKCYMWVLSNGEYEHERQIRIYAYHPGRDSKFIKELLQGFQGILQTDGYGAYECAFRNTGQVKHVFCWAHARRKFSEALLPDLKAEERKNTVSQQAIDRIGELFAADEKLKELPPAERQEARLRGEAPLLETLFAWLKTVRERGSVPANSAAGKAVNYTLNHQKELTSYLANGLCALSNNICERAIRNFTIGRKNWLFSTSPKGADASAAVYSLVETCKANHLDPYKYLLRIFTEFPNLDLKRHPERMDQFLPWTEAMQRTCK